MPVWSDQKSENVGRHKLCLLTVPESNLDIARDYTVAVIPDHYSSPEQLARVFDRLGKQAVSKLLRTKLPREKTKRSGDLGEIIATEYIAKLHTT